MNKKDNKQEVKQTFNLELLGYNKCEVDELVNALSNKIEVLTKDVYFLKNELKKYNKKDEKIFKPIHNSVSEKQLQS